MTGFDLGALLHAGWPTARFGSIFRESQERNAECPVGVALSVSEYRGVVPRDVSAGQLESEDVSSYRVVRPGQLAANVMWLNRSGLGVSSYTGYVSPAYKVFDIHDSIDARFADYLLRSGIYRAAFERLGRGVRPNAQMVDSVDLRALPVPVPPVGLQLSIADFLDRETAKIDALIEKQNALINRLRERRAETIASMVTGLTFEGQKRPTSDGWVTDLPESWSMARIGYGFEVVLGKMLDGGRAPQASDVLTPYLRAANVQPWGLALEDVNEMPFSQDEARRLSLRRDDLLVVEGGSVGMSWLMKTDLPGFSFQKTLNRVRARGRDSTHFLHYVLTYFRQRGVFDIICSGSTIAHLTAEKLRALSVPRPPLEDQRKIAERLDRETEKVDTLIAKAERFVELARERRSALITAAVTGQIDMGREAAA